MFLYKIENTINGKTYIGITNDVRTRMRDHFRSNSKCPAMKNAVGKYGKASFSFTILCEGSEDYIQSIEPKAIVSYKSHVKHHGYNIALGGIGSLRIDYKDIDKLLGTDSDARIAKLFNVNTKTIQRRRKAINIPVNSDMVKTRQSKGWFKCQT